MNLNGIAADRNWQWGMAWVFLALSLAIHVADEALTGFLPLYNSTVELIRQSWQWIPLPTIRFTVWLTGLISAVFALLGISRLAFQGRAFLRPISYVLGILMTGNAAGHMAASVYWGKPAPGVISSPVLLLAAVILLITTYRQRNA